MYVGSCNGLFRRLDAKTGKVRWETDVRGKPTKYFFHGDVFLASDRIVATTDVDASTGAEAGVHAFDRDSGRQLWMHPVRTRGVLGAVTGAGSRVFVYATTGDLIALNLDSGKPAWTYALKAPGWESPGVSSFRVFAGSSDGSVYALDGETGHVEWQQKLAAAISTSVRTTASDVYAGTADGTVHRLATGTGELRSSLKVDPVLSPTAAPLLTKNAVLVLLADPQANVRAVLSLDPALSRVTWRQNAPDRWTTSRVFATERTVLVGTSKGEVTAYCAADGSPAWSHKLANAPIRSIGGTDETLFVGTPEGTLYAIRPPQSCS